ncbi:MAG: XdhC family protein [Gemmatimonadota bacterium]|nr:XdhC family protein [Gemmatimonadota bacterium]
MDRHLLDVAARLLDQRRPYAVATVVRRERPSSATPGNTALITGDGTVHGFIGGSCTQPEVVRHALAALGDRNPRLLSFGGSPDGRDDMVMVPMACGSEGKVEVHVNPVFPAPQLMVAGESPIARAVARLGEAMGYEVADGLGGLGGAAAESAGAERAPGARLYAVVATMGQGDEEAVEQLIAARPDYLGVVVSPKRMLQVREYLAGRGICGSRIAEVHGPAGLDIGAERPEEVAVSILAEIVALGAIETRAAGEAGEARAAEEAAEADAIPAGAPASATDPVCGMTVAADGSRPSFTYQDNTYHFCCPGCRARFEADPAAYLAAAG